jgi:aspartate carbamoyltransferase regulatory subunit
MSVKKELLVRPIEHGTVIDHINAGQALNVMRIIGIARSTGSVVSIAMNVASKQMGLKDIVKIEGKELNSQQVDKISLISPDATINIIRNYDVVSKYNVELPGEIIGIVRCNNPDCITNSDEPVASSFTVTKKPVILRCNYCNHIISEEIAEQLI